MRDRLIEPAWIHAAIGRPDAAQPDPKYPNRTWYLKRIAEFDNRVLHVVTEPEGDDLVVVTTHFDRAATKRMGRR